jgi:cytochrome c oxidase subunit 1
MNSSQTNPTLIWTKLGILALGLSGLYSIALVFLRTPGITDLIINKDFFKTALVVHVDLSVLVWLLSGSVIIWLKNIHFFIPRIIYRIAFIGIILIALSPLMYGDPVMNNYIPMLDNLSFIVGISMFMTVIFIISVMTVSNVPRTHHEYSAFIGGCIFLVSFICFMLSYDKLNTEIIYPMDLHGFYEMLFWSGGHALQFLYMHSMYVIWLMLLGARKFPRLQILVMWINMLAAIPLVPIHLIYNIDSAEFISFCTNHMRYAAGISAACMMFVVITEIFYAEKESKWLFGVNASLLLFAAGGVIGILISEINVTIPAHYHGSIVGISIAVMTMVYYIIDADVKWPRIQVMTYAIGQMMHIGGLAWSGGYGVLRKNPDMILSMNAKISMGVMGLGGLLAIIGGLMFVVICGSKLWNARGDHYIAIHSRTAL